MLSQQQTNRMIDLAIDEQHGGDRRIAAPGARLNRRFGGNLAMQIGRGIAKHPRIAVARDRDLGLSSRSGCYGSVAHPAAVRAIAIPLRQAAAPKTRMSTLWRLLGTVNPRISSPQNTGDDAAESSAH